MKNFFRKLIWLFLLIISVSTFGQADSVQVVNDSINVAALQEFNQKLAEVEMKRVADSIKRAELELQLTKLKTTDNLQKDDLLKQLKNIEENEKRRISEKKSHIDSLRNISKGYPVIGVLGDTLFSIYSKIGASTPKERASSIGKKIKK